jgi:hypothetical protein
LPNLPCARLSSEPPENATSVFGSVRRPDTS